MSRDMFGYEALAGVFTGILWVEAREAATAYSTQDTPPPRPRHKQLPRLDVSSAQAGKPWVKPRIPPSGN